MSTPSSPNDGQSGRKEFFRQGLKQQPIYQSQQQQHQLNLQQQSFVNNSKIALQPQAPLLNQQQQVTCLNTVTNINAVQPPPPTTQFLHWTNPLMAGAPFLQPTAQPQLATAPSAQQHQQQHLNDFFLNIQAQAAYAAAAVPQHPQPTQVGSPPSPQETYSVLRVGNGNFLKIYHCSENAMSSLQGETSFTPTSPYNQQQTAAFHNINTQGGAAASMSLQQQQQQLPSQTQSTVSNNSAPSTQAFNSYELFSSSTFTQLPTAEMPPVLLLGPTTQLPPLTAEDLNDGEQNIKQSQPSGIETKNIVIHNMPNNWTSKNQTPSPLYAQFQKSQNENELDNPTSSLTNTNVIIATVETSNNDSNNDDAIINNSTLHKQQQQIASVKACPLITVPLKALQSTSLTTGTNSSEIPRQDAPKKRIIAEVKPMRMTYSDVLSKFNNQTQRSQQQQNQNNLNNNSNNNTVTITNITTNNVIRYQQKATKIEGNSNNLRRSGDDTNTAAFSAVRSSSKKSPTHENKENQLSQQQLLNNKVNYNNQKRSSSAVINTGSNTNNSLNINNNNNISSNNKTSSAATQKNLNISKNNYNNNSNNNCNTNDNQSLKKPRSNKNSENIQNNGVKNNNSEQRSTNKNNGGSTANHTSPAANTYNSTNNTYGRKVTKSSNSGNTSSSAAQSRSRYQNNSNVSYSYSSTKRSRNNSSYGTSSSLNNSSFSNGSDKNRNYELAKRFLQAWYTYTMKILIWLFNLVYDIVVLGCSILYERLSTAFEYGKAYAKQLYKDLRQNSNKPSIWFKNYCRKIDGKFSKTSKWAIWRRFYKKKPPETTSESIKTGRLPATGEEAMFQLLNCKGKDAYSILGVPPNSSQEQIRKHYKKIAVLVHPDKNKQAGAEEAFKVLQRAFELIGEPENRLAYDQSLEEALNAEKAWTELHDLLSQLQTKITEAANTIRCSTCGLRHPRRITDRPHYAARECASCKIRHSAREGDIWAETSLLGLRWKYLALMEGKVYDITEWANCQKGALAHLEPNSHMVQYRIVRGAQQQHQQKQQAHQQQQHQKHTGSQFSSGGGVGGKFKRETTIPPSEASLHEFLDNLYSGQNPQQQPNTSTYAGSSRRRNRRN